MFQKLALAVLFVTSFVSLSAHALAPHDKASERELGVSNFREVMPGVLYRGGSSGPQGQTAPLSSSSLHALCEKGFSSAVYAYKKNWNGGGQTSCSSGELNYTLNRWDRSNEVRDALETLHDIITNGRGPMYVHCYYGVHASGYIAAVALVQFCGLSNEEGVSYWKDNVPATIQYAPVQELIRNFRPYSDLQITQEQRSKICPN